LQIKLHFIQSYSTKSLKKTFSVDQILEQYKQANNQKKQILKNTLSTLSIRFQNMKWYKKIAK